MSAVPSAIELAKDIDKAALAPISDFAIDKVFEKVGGSPGVSTVTNR